MFEIDFNIQSKGAQKLSERFDDSQILKIERLKILTEQYKLLEERRKSFGREFIQTLGFFIALFTILIGFLGEKNLALLTSVLRVGGVIFILIAFLAHRLGVRQDDCEGVMAEIETQFQDELNSSIGSLPPAAKFGARRVIVIVLLLAGVLLLIQPAWRGFNL